MIATYVAIGRQCSRCHFTLGITVKAGTVITRYTWNLELINTCNYRQILDCLSIYPRVILLETLCIAWLR